MGAAAAGCAECRGDGDAFCAGSAAPRAPESLFAGPDNEFLELPVPCATPAVSSAATAGESKGGVAGGGVSFASGGPSTNAGNFGSNLDAIANGPAPTLDAIASGAAPPRQSASPIRTPMSSSTEADFPRKPSSGRAFSPSRDMTRVASDVSSDAFDRKPSMALTASRNSSGDTPSHRGALGLMTSKLSSATSTTERSPDDPCSIWGGTSSAMDPASGTATPLTHTEEADVHPFLRDPTLSQCIRLIKLSAFENLQSPMPRSQDLPPSCFQTPQPDDIVVAVSHAWRNQTHPDPCGVKKDAIVDLLDRRPPEEYNRTLLFVDFLSIPQRPFMEGQPDRTEEQNEIFDMAIRCMHKVYLVCDRTIHLDGFMEVIPGESEVYKVKVADLAGAMVAEVGEWVQIVAADRSPDKHKLSKDSMLRRLRGKRNKGAGGMRTAPFDRVTSIGGDPISSLAQMEQYMGDLGSDLAVCMQRYPFGRVNTIPAKDRGWIFLERFITMVKCAMLDKESAEDAVLSNCLDISTQIEEGAERLRTAAMEDSENPVRRRSEFDLNADINSFKRGEGTGFSRQGSISQALATLFKPSRELMPKLPQVLGEFSAELNKKQFSASSTDKLVIDHSLQSRRCADAMTARASEQQDDMIFKSEASVDDDHPDRRFVKRIMADFVKHLAKHWTHEKARQASRQAALKTSRKFRFSPDVVRIKFQRCCATLPVTKMVKRKHDVFARSTSPLVRAASPLPEPWQISPTPGALRRLGSVREISPP